MTYDQWAQTHKPAPPEADLCPPTKPTSPYYWRDMVADMLADRPAKVQLPQKLALALPDDICCDWLPYADFADHYTTILDAAEALDLEAMANRSTQTEASGTGQSK